MKGLLVRTDSALLRTPTFLLQSPPPREHVPAHCVRLTMPSLNRPDAIVVAYSRFFVCLFCGRIVSKQIFSNFKDVFKGTFPTTVSNCFTLSYEATVEKL